MTDDDEMLERLGKALGHDPQRTPPPDRVAAIRAAAEQLRHGQGKPDAPASPSHREVDEVGIRRASRRRLFLAGGIAAGVGGIAGYVVRDVNDTAAEPAPPVAGPPTEDITFEGAASVESTAALINHTWGTELMLEVSGLEPGTTYDVVYRTTDGGEVAAGSLLAVDVPMTCRFNGAPLRADVAEIAVRDASGAPVLRSELPTLRA